MDKIFTHLVNDPSELPPGTRHRVIGVQLAFWDNKTLVQVESPVDGLEPGPIEYPNTVPVIDEGFDKQQWETVPEALPDTTEAEAVELLTKLNLKNPEAVSRAIAISCKAEQLAEAVAIKALPIEEKPIDGEVKRG